MSDAPETSRLADGLPLMVAIMQKGAQRSRGVMRRPLTELAICGVKREIGYRKWIQMEINGTEQGAGMRDEQVKNWKNRAMFQ